MENVEIKQEYVLPLPFRFFAFILIPVGLILVINNLNDLMVATTPSIGSELLGLVGGITIILVASIMITAHYRLKIDITNTTYHLYVWVLGKKTGTPTKFNFIESFYVNKVKEKGAYTTRAGIKHDTSDTLYKAFIKMDDGEKFNLDSDKNEEKLNERVKIYMEQMKSIYKPI